MYGMSVPPPRTVRGRPFAFPTVRLNITITPELRAWLYAQDEDASALIRSLLEAEQARREASRVVQQRPQDRRRPGRRAAPAS